MNWDDVDAFCHVIEHGGFSAAARAMNRPKSTISVAIARLETHINVRLLQRTTRRVSPTEAGISLDHDVGPTFKCLREVEVDAMGLGQVVAGTLRIAAPYQFGAHAQQGAQARRPSGLDLHTVAHGEVPCGGQGRCLSHRLPSAAR